MPAQPREDGSVPVRVLIVDDEPSISFGLSHTLRRRGYEVETAGTAAEGRAKAAEFAPDLVLLDLRLPDDDGLNVLDALRRLPRPPRVVLMSGFALAETAQTAMERGASRVIKKPVDIDVLLGIVADVLKG